MNLLIINTTDGTIYYYLIGFDLNSYTVILEGKITDIGSKKAEHSYSYRNHNCYGEGKCFALTYRDAVIRIYELLRRPGSFNVEFISLIEGIAYKLPSGGDLFKNHQLITPSVLTTLISNPILRELNHVQIEVIETALELFPSLHHVAIFDSVFFSELPLEASIYPIPLEYYQKGIKRYGYHGIVHSYLVRRGAELLSRFPEELKIITCYIDKEVSITAVKYGQPIDTTGGLSRLDGLLMSNSSGIVDPYLMLYLIKEQGYTPEEAYAFLKTESGLVGMTGYTESIEEIILKAEKGENYCKVALSLFTYQMAKVIGAYWEMMGGANLIIFSGYWGRTSFRLRELILERLPLIKQYVKLDRISNEVKKGDRFITQDISPLKIVVIEEDELKEVAFQSYNCLRGRATEEV